MIWKLNFSCSGGVTRSTETHDPQNSMANLPIYCFRLKTWWITLKSLLKSAKKVSPSFQALNPTLMLRQRSQSRCWELLLLAGLELDLPRLKKINSAKSHCCRWDFSVVTLSTDRPVRVLWPKIVPVLTPPALKYFSAWVIIRENTAVGGLSSSSKVF